MIQPPADRAARRLRRDRAREAAGARQVPARGPRPTARRELAEAFALDTVAAARRDARWSRRCSWSPTTRRSRRAAASPWAPSVPDGAGDDLNETLVQAAAEVARRWPDAACRWRCAPTCRRLRPDELAAALADGPARRAAGASCADAAGTGTTLFAAPAGALRPAVRRRRRAARHAARAPSRSTRPWPRLRRDVDDPVDLGAALAAGRRAAHPAAQRLDGGPPRPERTRRRPPGRRRSRAQRAEASGLAGGGLLRRGLLGRRRLLRRSLAGSAFLAGAFLAARCVDFVARLLGRAPSSPTLVFVAGAFFAGAFVGRAPSSPAPSSPGAVFFAAVDFVAGAFLAAARSFVGGAGADLAGGAPSSPAPSCVAAPPRLPPPPRARVAAAASAGVAATVSFGSFLRPGDDGLEVGAGGELRHRLLLRLDPLAGLRVAHPAGVAHAASRTSRSR